MKRNACTVEGRVLICLSICMFVVRGVAGAQTIQLRAPSAHIDHEFARVSGVRELPDGRVLVVDRGNRELILVDPASGSARHVGRQGDGPAEYRFPASIFALRADSSLVVDAQLRRWLILVGDRIVSTLPANREPIRLLGMTVVGTDLDGRFASLLGEPEQLQMKTAIRREARYLVAGTLDRARLDTLVTLHARRASTAARRGSTTYFLENPLAVDEQGLLMADGWVAIARLSPYRIEWLSPDKKRMLGAPLNDVVRPLTESGKRSAIAREWFVPGYTGPRWEPEDFTGWPATAPEFLRDALLATPEGELAVARTALDGAAGILYDVFDRRGVRTRQITLPDGARLVGFGRGTAYVAHRTDDDLEGLKRHPWP